MPHRLDLKNVAFHDRVRAVPQQAGGQPGTPPPDGMTGVTPAPPDITPASFTLVLTPFERRPSSGQRDVLYGLYSNTAPGALLVDSDGNNPFPLDWFEDGTPAADAGLRFFGVKFSDYILMRFGRQARSGSSEIVGPHLKQAVREGIHLRYFHGGLIGEFYGITDPSDPYYFLPTNGNIGSIARRAFAGNTPMLLQISYPEPLTTPPHGSFSWETILWNQPTNEDKFSLFFDRVYSETHSVGTWTRRNSGSTPTPLTGPASNNTSSFYFIETTGTNLNTAEQREIESARFINENWLRGTHRTMTIRACIQGSAFAAENTGLRVRQFGNLFNDGTIIDSDLPWVDTLYRGWPFRNDWVVGGIAHAYGGVQHTVVENGGWVDIEIPIHTETSHVVINGEYAESSGHSLVSQGDIAIQRVSMTGQIG